MQVHHDQAQDAYVPLPLRAHTILGVCEGIGEDFGFNPVFLRVLLATGVLISPTMAIGSYFGLGLVVLASRLLFPRRKASAAAGEPTIEAHNDHAASQDMSIAA
jgi:phage shock protein PspC (stress-responsive transcriptional regulator)